MKCKKCGSENVTIQAVQETWMENHHHNVVWWIFVGWWWLPAKWLFLAVPALIGKLFFRRKTLKQKTVSKCTCQDCGYTWDA